MAKKTEISERLTNLKISKFWKFLKQIPKNLKSENIFKKMKKLKIWKNSKIFEKKSENLKKKNEHFEKKISKSKIEKRTHTHITLFHKQLFSNTSFFDESDNFRNEPKIHDFFFQRGTLKSSSLSFKFIRNRFSIHFNNNRTQKHMISINSDFVFCVCLLSASSFHISVYKWNLKVGIYQALD